MNEQTIDLAKRAVACKGWRWMEGMAWIVARITPLEDIRGRVVSLNGSHQLYPDALPDLDDPATKGCLLALVREARQDPGYRPYCGYDGHAWIWWAECPSSQRQTSYDSEAAALVAALEAAP
jgi:hypothetical protein